LDKDIFVISVFMLAIGIAAQLVWYFLAHAPCPGPGEMPQLLGAPCSPLATVASLQEIQNVSGLIMFFGFILLPIGLFKDGLPVPGPGGKVFLGVLLVLLLGVAATYVLTIPVSAHMAAAEPCGSAPKGSTVFVCMTTTTGGGGYAFSPSNITVIIDVNNTVQWSNNGGTTHTTTSFPSGQAQSWDSGDLNVGQTFTYSFTTPGTYTYICTIHPFMHGVVIVKPKP
jgi:plastocyanin